MKKKLVPVLLCMSVLILNGCGGQNEIRVNGVRTEVSGDRMDADISEESGFRDTETVSEEKETDRELVVYVCGAVMEPSVCRLKQGARVCDAIEAAGGFAPDADTQWLNQAEFLQDAGMITVYTKEETARMKESGSGIPQAGAGMSQAGAGMPASDSAAADYGSDAVNLNTASKEQLMTLPGIGESKAGAILRYREENGPFSCIEDVMNISGIKESIFSQIRDHVTV